MGFWPWLRRTLSTGQLESDDHYLLPWRTQLAYPKINSFYENVRKLKISLFNTNILINTFAHISTLNQNEIIIQNSHSRPLRYIVQNHSENFEPYCPHSLQQWGLTFVKSKFTSFYHPAILFQHRWHNAERLHEPDNSSRFLLPPPTKNKTVSERGNFLAVSRKTA